MGKIIIIFLLIFTGVKTIKSQGNVKTHTDKEVRKIKKELADKQIKELKNGVLLVQLKTKQKTIDAYRRTGNKAKAEVVRLKQLVDNKNIIKGFRDYFDFTKVYFYYSHDQKKVKNGDYKSVKFIDTTKLDKDTLYFVAVSPLEDNDTTNVYIAEFTTHNLSNSILNDIPGYDNTYDRGTAFPALIIKNRKFKQLASPFPYYVKTHEGLKVKDLKRWETIKKMNTKLNYYYQSR